MLIKVGIIQQDGDNIPVLVVNGQRTATSDMLNKKVRKKCKRLILFIKRMYCAGWSAFLDKIWVFCTAFLQQLSKSHTPLYFINSRIFTITGNTDHFCTGRFWNTIFQILINTHTNNSGCCAKCLDIIYDSRQIQKTFLNRKKPAGPGFSSFTFSRFKQCGLFSANIRSRSHLYFYIKMKICNSPTILSQKAFFPVMFNGFFKSLL